MKLAAAIGQQSQRMDISVVIPSYNRADLLPFTLDSVLNQTVPPLEVIVVDDGSSDDTQSVLSRYQPRVHAITIENSGSIVARNVGLRAACGRLVAFCDSDDLWRPDFLERMAGLWSAEPRTRVAYANFCIVRNDVWASGTKFEDGPPGYWDDLRSVGEGMGVFDHPIVQRVVRWQPFFPSALVADRTALIEVGGWDEGVGRIVGDDFGTVLRLAELYPIGVVSAPLVGIRKHPGNFSADVMAMNLGDAKVLEYALASRPSLLQHAALIHRSIAMRRRDALESAFATMDFVAVRMIYGMLPPYVISKRIRLKRLIAGLRQPVATGIARLLARAG